MPNTADRAPVWIYVDCVCDLFHMGHVRFFEQARAFGDRLIVGLHSDEDVMTYKPAPILTWAERIEVVRACRLVDRVVEHPVPLHVTPAALESYGATYVCHGDDMPPEELEFWYGDLVTMGRLKVASYTAGISSREIVARVADRLKAGTLRVKL